MKNSVTASDAGMAKRVHATCHGGQECDALPGLFFILLRLTRTPVISRLL